MRKTVRRFINSTRLIMKTKITHPLGAGLPQLVTFGSQQKSTARARLLTIGVATIAAAPSMAAPQRGGGSSRGSIGGTIYYAGPWPNATNGGTAVMTAMKPDGSNQTTLGLGLF